VLYTTLEATRGGGRPVQKLVARAGGNRRVIDTYYGRAEFPEVSFSLDPTGQEPGVSKDEWHRVVLTWQGYPEGTLRMFVDGELAGEQRYTSHHDNGLPLPAYLGIGVRPTSWTGEIEEGGEGDAGDGVAKDSRPQSTLAVAASNIELRDPRLYRRALSEAEIRSLAETEGLPA
jgi:hypothetical protein